MRRSILLAVLGLILAGPAHARHNPPNNLPCSGFAECLALTQGSPLERRPGRAARVAAHSIGGAGALEAQILPHPAGCPRVAFCGCGAAVEVFGRSIRSLWLAANWLRFPPAAPAPGMVAVRRGGGHVFVIEQVLGDGQVLAYDANSGHHQTRRHVRSLAGYSVRNPRGGVPS